MNPPVDHLGGPGGSGEPRLARWRDPRVARVLGGLAAVALFASLAGEWITETHLYDGVTEVQTTAGLTHIGAWGSAWVVGALALATAGGLALLGPPPLRPAARAAGLSLAGAMLAVLVAAAAEFRQRGGTMFAILQESELEVSLGRGMYAGYLAVGLAGAALWLAQSVGGPAVTGVAPDGAPGAVRPREAPDESSWEPLAASSGEPPEEPPAARPGELTVGPAEPFVHPTDDHEWR